jgi:hypothetical protein
VPGQNSAVCWLAEIRSWEPDQNAIAFDATKTSGLSLKIHGHVFAYLRPWPVKQFFIIHGPNEDGKWIDIHISAEGEELEKARKLVRDSMQRLNPVARDWFAKSFENVTLVEESRPYRF